MEVYIQAISDFYQREHSPNLSQKPSWPHSFDSLQERLGEEGLIAISQVFTREVFLEHLERRDLPILLVSRDWKRFHLAIPAPNLPGKWDFWEDERFLGRFTPEQVIQRGIGEDSLAYLIIPRNLYPSPFHGESDSPWSRLARLFSAESRLVAYIYLYAAVSGGLSLLVPVVVQAIYTYIQALYLQWITGLTTLIFLAAVVLIAYALVRIGQYVIIEHLQRRLFLHSTLEIVHHVPRWFYPAVVRENLPSLINRYFEIFTIEKNLAKLLIDVPANILVIIFGIVLLSFYAPFFAFSVFLLGIVVGTFLYYSFPSAYKKKKAISDEKYRMAAWLEETARALLAFKLAGFPPLLYRRTQELEERYLRGRQHYFSQLLRQKALLYFYQISIALIMISMGAFLVLEQRISLGQFVASELVLFLIMGAVQSLISHLDALYDLLVGLEKFSQIFTPPTEKISGIPLPQKPAYSISFQNVSLKIARDGTEKLLLGDLNLEIEAGEKVCLTGSSGSGKSTILYLLYGLYPEYQGEIYIEGVNLRQADLLFLRGRIGDALSPSEIIEATIWENLTLAHADISWEEVMEVCEELGLKASIDKLPQGFFTSLPPQGKGILSGIDQRKLILARALLTHPSLLFVDDLFATLSWEQKVGIYRYILSPKQPYTAIIVSQDPRVMEMCNRVILFKDGRVEFSGSFRDMRESYHYIS
ncbi:MAG: ATP-binding cassette domain-containing protein [Bacteroidia bacterium]|nr:ATP-binding cassette domain-containing protein [Bacteroidia bacterium]MDW8235867.1 ATP-binding cassette domain-containing protein [Bacteroidia bacterium]